MATVEQRVSYLEGRLESLATKEDVANAKTDVIKWMVAIQFLGLGAVAAVMRFAA